MTWSARYLQKKISTHTGGRVLTEPTKPTLDPETGGFVSFVSAGSLEPVQEKTAPPAPLAADEKTAVRAWLASIQETDPATIAEVIGKCQRDPRARAYVLELARDIPAPVAPRAVRCGDCKHFERGTHHPNLGHCARGQPGPPAGLCDGDLRWCVAFSLLGK